MTLRTKINIISFVLQEENSKDYSNDANILLKKCNNKLRIQKIIAMTLILYDKTAIISLKKWNDMSRIGTYRSTECNVPKTGSKYHFCILLRPSN